LSSAHREVSAGSSEGPDWKRGSPDHLESQVVAVQVDPSGSLDAVLDEDNMPLAAEPASVRKDLETLGTREDTQ
jgi:hypothetical protein